LLLASELRRFWSASPGQPNRWAIRRWIQVHWYFRMAPCSKH